MHYSGQVQFSPLSYDTTAPQPARAFKSLSSTLNSYACALMLDALGVPVVMVVGSVYATDESGHVFWLNRLGGPAFPGHNPGHAWLLTPWWRVADLALMHQFGVAGDYDNMRDSLHPVITVNSNETLEPEVGWWRFEDGLPLPADGYVETTKYHAQLYTSYGWALK